MSVMQKNPSLSDRIIVGTFRAIFFTLGIFLTNYIWNLGTSPWVLALSAIAGIVLSSELAKTALNWRGFGVFVAGIVIGEKLLAYLLTTANRFAESSVMWSVPFIGHLELSTWTLLLACISTWIFWRVRAAITCEVIAAGGIAIYLLASHRGFHLDRPRIINSLAWSFGVEPLTMLLLIGSGFLVAILLYLLLASRAIRPATSDISVKRVSDRRSIALSFVSLIIFVAVLYGIERILANHYHQQLSTLTANGVGQGSSTGMSPLGFHSALGSTNQPAALMRLEGDYRDNPFSPMLYLRESALSSFNGHEMVFAGREYDSDIPATAPDAPFTGKEDETEMHRTPVVQSIYTLADQENVFAIDYPLSIQQLKNPNPGRFKVAYKAYSVAPAWKISDIEDVPVGDPRWSPEVLAHYTEKHTDPRYADLAKKLTEDSVTPAEKVFAITNYLSRTAIYTLSPGHEIASNEDPVAPFLFGDHRGYCVHFAHAIVYMLRGIGIPSRVGTGYLTDLSQAKDGHILLRMSDRHAWAEAYFEGYGWIPFDVQPDHVESHADTQVDSKMLEDLMGLLEPGEELLPPDLTKDEPGMEPTSEWVSPPPTALYLAIGLIFGSLVLIKFYLRFGWLIPGSSRSLTRRYYLSAASRLHDLGVCREFGETRTEFERRISCSSKLSLGGLSEIVSNQSYQSSFVPDRLTVRQSYSNAQSSLKTLPLWKRFLMVINPASVFAFIGGERW